MRSNNSFPKYAFSLSCGRDLGRGPLPGGAAGVQSFGPINATVSNRFQEKRQGHGGRGEGDGGGGGGVVVVGGG
eukprot:499994-Prymnesium_polylepis.1